ncbi:MAG: D-alanyl-D-alanine carboxypeptidase [Actinomycetota bacterium]|nr:MAG: D-alanyl-D-alanine carboxypeptidase [Actinomycetota bacterium]
MRRNDSWLSPGSSSPYSRGVHYGNSRSFSARPLAIILVLVVLLFVLSVIQLLRPVPYPAAHATVSDSVIPGAAPSLPWPSQGGGEIEIQNIGPIGGFNVISQIPLASVAKIVSALVIVKDHPLAPGNTGPALTLTAGDVATYHSMLQQQDSVMAITAGEQLNEYQLLEALLIPSADNISSTLAIWDAGSTSAFVAKMNAMAKSLGMTRTVFKDPTGLNSGTVGTAPDQVLAALALLKNPVLAQIVAMPQATFPVVGVDYNVNYDVGHDGFVGVKTGSMGSDGNLVFAATLAGSKDLIVGSILGQGGVQPLTAALLASTKLVNAARKVPAQFTVLKQGQIVATMSAPGAQPEPVEASKSVSFLGWPGLRVTFRARFINPGHSVPKGTKVGSLTVAVGGQSAEVPLITTKSIQSPSLAWRLKRL